MTNSTLDEMKEELAAAANLLRQFADWAFDQHAETGVNWRELNRLASNASFRADMANELIAKATGSEAA